jgi:hypothetical protein
MSFNPLNKLCGPAHFYLVISILFLAMSSLQNMGSSNVYCLGSLTCNVTSVTLIFAIQLVYVLFWTWVLNLMCNTGVEKLAWVLVLFPFILMFLAIIALMFQ